MFGFGLLAYLRRRRFRRRLLATVALVAASIVGGMKLQRVTDGI
jgi:hydrogenase/urease accessory protein HupE